MKKLIFILTILASATALQAQDEDLLGEITSMQEDTVKLLPDRIMPTQWVLWSEKGLMRNFDYFELTPEKRQNELKIRRAMLIGHQAMGFATLGGMVAQGIVGAKLYTGNQNYRDAHEVLAVGVNFGYFTTAGLSLFAPPKMLNERKGYSNIKLHKALAVIHLTGMIATNILASQVEHNSSIRPYHRAAAYTSFGAFAISMIVIKF